jgi:hypothetical protein
VSHEQLQILEQLSLCRSCNSQRSPE